jgi:hypothetical protein
MGAIQGRVEHLPELIILEVFLPGNQLRRYLVLTLMDPGLRAHRANKETCELLVRDKILV